MEYILANLFTDIWNQGILRPMINSLVFLYSVLFSNMGLSIIAFTIIIRILTTPLTLKQIRQMRAMSALQPRMQKIRDKFKGDSKRISQETMKMYREAGVNPIGCLGPLLIQFPIWIGLFQALVQTLPTNPDRLVALSEKLYSWVPYVHEAIPLNSQFLWLNLAEPDPTNIVMPILVGASTWGGGGGGGGGPAENDIHALGGPAPAVHPVNDALDDAHHARPSQHDLPQRPCPLLGGIERGGRIHPVSNHRLGASLQKVQRRSRR